MEAHAAAAVLAPQLSHCSPELCARLTQPVVDFLIVTAWLVPCLYEGTFSTQPLLARSPAAAPAVLAVAAFDATATHPPLRQPRQILT